MRAWFFTCFVLLVCRVGYRSGPGLDPLEPETFLTAVTYSTFTAGLGTFSEYLRRGEK